MVKPYKHSFSVNFLLLIILTTQTVMPTFLPLIQNCNVHLSSIDTDCNVHLSSFERDCYISIFLRLVQTVMSIVLRLIQTVMSIFLRLIQTVMSIFLGGTIFQKTEQAAKTQPKQDKSFSFIFHRF